MTHTRILKSAYLKVNKGEELINKYMGQSSIKKSIVSLSKTKQKSSMAKNKESIYAFTSRFNKKMFCHLSATEIESIMNDNRQKIETQSQGLRTLK